MAALVAARALLQDRKPWQELVQHLMEESKPALEHFLKENGVKFYPGEANFLLVEPKGGAAPAVSYLREQGILVRPMRPPLEHCFRMSPPIKFLKSLLFEFQFHEFQTNHLILIPIFKIDPSSSLFENKVSIFCPVFPGIVKYP